MYSPQQIALVAAPPVLLASTYFVFKIAKNRIGPIRGYLVGFLFYWIFWGFLFPWFLLGSSGLAYIFRDVPEKFGNPAWLGTLLLLLPLVLGYAYAFPRSIRHVTFRILLVSLLIAVVNGTLEELLWRGAYVSLFPQQWTWAYLYPTIGFAVWHFAPQAVFPSRSPGGNLALVIVAGLVGGMWGWVAFATGSILWTTLSHILFDFSGLGGRIYFPDRSAQ